MRTADGSFDHARCCVEIGGLPRVDTRSLQSKHIRGLLVEEPMTRAPFTIRTGLKLPDATRVMLGGRFSGLPVLNLEGELVGFLTKAELTEPARERF